MISIKVKLSILLYSGSTSLSTGHQADTSQTLSLGLDALGIHLPVIGPFPMGKDCPFIQVEVDILHKAPCMSGSFKKC